MNQVSNQELSQHTETTMARVERGGTVEVTRQGKVIARIVPVSSDEGAAPGVG